VESDSLYMFCTACKTILKRQILGSNVFYYCRNCGCVSSEAYLSKEVNTFDIQESASAN